MLDVRVKAFGAAAGVLLLDRLTKWIVETHISLGGNQPVIPGFFDIWHAENRGVAFSILDGSSSAWLTAFLVGFSLTAIVLVGGFILRRADRMDRSLLVGLSLILGGAAGNLFDRIVSGRVTDFLDFHVGGHHWPAFNVADSAIVIGSGLLLLVEAFRAKRQAANVP